MIVQGAVKIHLGPARTVSFNRKRSILYIFIACAKKCYYLKPNLGEYSYQAIT